MRTETLSLIISGDGKLLGAELGRAEGRVKTFGGRVKGIMSGVGKGIAGAVGKLANPLALIGGAAGVIMAARDLAEYQDKLSTLGISAGMSGEEMFKFQERIQAAAYATGQSRDGLVLAAQAMAGIAGAEFAADALEAVGKAATATSTDVGEVAKAFASFRRDMGATTEEAARMFNTMAAMGNTQSMDRFARSAQSLGLTMDTFAGYNALIKTLDPSFGGADAAAGAVDAIIKELKTNKKNKQLRGLFSEALDSKGAVKDFGKFLSIIAGMKENVRRNIFRGAGAGMIGFDINKAAAAFDGYMKKAENASHVTDAFARKQGEAKYQLNMLGQAAKEFAGAALGPVLSDLTESLTKLTANPKAMKEFRDNLNEIAGVLGDVATVAVAAAKAIAPIARYFANSARKGDSIKGVAAIPAQERAALLREFFVDPDKFARAHGEIDLKEIEARAQKMEGDNKYNVLGRMGVLAVSAAWGNDQAAVKAREERMAALIADRDASNARYEARQAAPASAPQVTNAINLNVQIAPDGRVTTETSDPNTKVAATANRGRFDK